MKKIIFLFTILCFAVVSCTKDKTDYEAEINTVVTDYYEFKEAVSINSGNYKTAFFIWVTTKSA